MFGVAETYATTRKGRNSNFSSEQLLIQQQLDGQLILKGTDAELETLLELYNTLHPDPKRARAESLQALRGRRVTIASYVDIMIAMTREELYPKTQVSQCSSAQEFS